MLTSRLTNGAYKWRLQMALTNGAYKWRLQMALTNGAYKWRLQMARTHSASVCFCYTFSKKVSFSKKV